MLRQNNELWCECTVVLCCVAEEAACYGNTTSSQHQTCRYFCEFTSLSLWLSMRSCNNSLTVKSHLGFPICKGTALTLLVGHQEEHPACKN